MEVLIIIVLSLIICVCLYVIKNMLNKTEILETWIEAAINNLHSAIKRMRDTDIRGSFESDDEVGYAFKALLAIVLTLESVLQYGTNEDS